MSARDHLSPQQFNGYSLTHELDDDGHHVITAKDLSGKHAGFLDWMHTGGEIYDIGVENNHQRKGLATAMYRYAQHLSATNKSIPSPQHSGTRTDEGDAWAKSVGGRLPAEEIHD